MSAFSVHNVRFMPAAPDVRATGMRGWVGFEVGAFMFDSVSVRRRRDGVYHLSYPVRVDGNGIEHPYVRPITAAARAEIESAVLAHLEKKGFISL